LVFAYDIKGNMGRSQSQSCTVYPGKQKEEKKELNLKIINYAEPFEIIATSNSTEDITSVDISWTFKAGCSMYWIERVNNGIYIFIIRFYFGNCTSTTES
jgi:hypothetical protein